MSVDPGGDGEQWRFGIYIEASLGVSALGNGYSLETAKKIKKANKAKALTDLDSSEWRLVLR